MRERKTLIDIKVTPTEYRKLWWDSLFEVLPEVFTMRELHDMLLALGVDYQFNNLNRDAQKYMSIEVVPEVTLKTKNGRPPNLWRRIR